MGYSLQSVDDWIKLRQNGQLGLRQTAVVPSRLCQPVKVGSVLARNIAAEIGIAPDKGKKKAGLP
jgi:hypothetical protein